MEIVYTLDQISSTANQVLKYITKNNQSVIAIYGKMGAGKTTLIKELCDQLGVIDTVQSPTFAIINQYQTADGFPVFHFDFYRLDKLQDALNIGAEEILYSGELCFIEWPEIIEPILPETTLKLYIEEVDDNTRKLVFNGKGEHNNSGL